MKEYIEERAVAIANYIIDHNATVRQAARKFGISKSTVHTEVTQENGSFGGLNKVEVGFSHSGNPTFFVLDECRLFSY